MGQKSKPEKYLVAVRINGKAEIFAFPSRRLQLAFGADCSRLGYEYAVTIKAPSRAVRKG